MTRRITDLDYLEQQLQEVEGRLQQAVTLLNNLKTVQEKFKDLAAYYKTTKTNFDQSQIDLGVLKTDFQANIQGAEDQLQGFGQRFFDFEQRAERRLEQFDSDEAALRKKTEEQLQDLTQAAAERVQSVLSDSEALIERTRQQVQALAQEAAQHRESLQADFAALSQDMAGQVDTLTGEVSARSNRLQSEFDSFQIALRGDLKTAEDNLQVAFRNLRGDMERDASVLRGDLEKRLATYRGDLEAATRLMQQSVDDALSSVESVKTDHRRLQDEVKAVADKQRGIEERLGQLQTDMKPLDARLTGVQGALQKSDQERAAIAKKQTAQQRLLNGLVVTALLAALIALLLPLLNK